MYVYNSMSREISTPSVGTARVSASSAVRRVDRVEMAPMTTGTTTIRYTVNSVGSDRRNSFQHEQGTPYKSIQSKAITTERIVSVRPLQMPSTQTMSPYSKDQVIIPAEEIQRHTLLSSSITPTSFDFTGSRTGLAETSIKRASMCREVESKELDNGRRNIAVSHLNERTDTKSMSSINGTIETMHASYQKIDFASVKTIRALGKGSFGEVMLGEWYGTPIAIKRYLDDPKSALGAVEEFNAELQALSILNHPKIVRFLGACASPPCVFMEYYQRGSLDEHLHTTRTQFNAKQTFMILHDIALGMIYVHQCGVLHRDLKPQNILLDSSFAAKISDFGLAITGVKSESKMFGMAGTIPYMAPEILLKQPYGFSADSYSFGVLVNELFGVQRPYEGMSAEIVMKEMQSRGIRPRVSPCVPAIAEVIALCWADHPSLRPGFAKISDIMKTLLEGTEKLPNVMNSVLGTVGKLLTSMETAITSDFEEARKSLTCLRDMLDPGNDCYDFAEVQGAFLIADGCKRLIQSLLSGKTNNNTTHNADPIQILACEVLTNACNANNRCQNILCELGVVRSLVKIIITAKSFSLLYHSLNCLRKVCESHPGNKNEAAAAGAGQALSRWIHVCLPTEGLTSDESSHIPGLQAGDASSCPSDSPLADRSSHDIACTIVASQSQQFFTESEAKAIVEMSTCCLFAILSRKNAVSLSTSETCGIATLIRCLSVACTKKAQEYAASSLWLALEADERNVELFCKADGTRELLNIIEHGSEDVKKWTAAALNAACVDARVRNDISTLNGVQILCNLLSSDCLPTCHHASKALDRSFMKEENIVLAVRCGFFPLVLKVLHAREQVQHAGLINCISTSFANTVAIEEVCKAGYLRNLLEVLKSENSNAAETVLRALLVACNSSLECQDVFVKQGGLKQIAEICLKDCSILSKPYLELCMAASNRLKIFDFKEHHWIVDMTLELLALDKNSKYTGSEETCILSIQLLWAATEHNPSCRDALHAANGVARLIQILKHGPAKCKRYVCAAVRTACIDSPANRQQLYEADGVPEILKFLLDEINAPPAEIDNDSENHWKAIEHAIAALNNGCCKYEKNCDAAHCHDVFSILLKLFVPASPGKIKEMSAVAIVNLCSCQNVCPNLKWVGAIQSALRTYKDDMSSSQSGCKYASAALAILDGLSTNTESASHISGPIDVVT